jgi:hypothetical protein
LPPTGAAEAPIVAKKLAPATTTIAATPDLAPYAAMMAGTKVSFDILVMRFLLV